MLGKGFSLPDGCLRTLDRVAEGFQAHVRTGTHPSATSITIVVSFFRIDTCRQLWSQRSDSLVMVWIEPLRILETCLVMVKAPGVDEHDCAFWDLHTIDPVVCLRQRGQTTNTLCTYLQLGNEGMLRASLASISLLLSRSRRYTGDSRNHPRWANDLRLPLRQAPSAPSSVPRAI